MTLPLSRNTTYTAASQVKSADLNAIQDMIIGRRHGTLTIPIDVRRIVLVSTGAAGVTYTNVLITRYGTDINASASPISAAVTLDGLANGTVIRTIRVYLKDVSAQPVLTTKLYGSDRAGSSTANATSANSAANGATQTITINLATPHIVGTTTPGAPFLGFTTASNATGTYSIYGIEIDIDK